MTSPAKRPAVTYQRGPSRKIASTSTVTLSSALNPDMALQQKINDLLFSKENKLTMAGSGIEEEFDSAYHETTVKLNY
jgi:hypothetical protein